DKGNCWPLRFLTSRLFGWSVDRLVCQPGSYFWPAPPFGRIPSKQAAKKESDGGIKPSGHLNAASHYVDLKRLLIDVSKAVAAGCLLEDNHAQAPPIGGRTARTADRLRR